MRELSIIINVHPLHTSQATSYQFYADEFEFVPTVEKTAAGVLFNCDKDLVITHPGDSCCTAFSSPLPCIVTYKDSFGKSITVGSKKIPARVNIIPHLNTATLQVMCKMLTSPL